MLTVTIIIIIGFLALTIGSLIHHISITNNTRIVNILVTIVIILFITLLILAIVLGLQ